MAKKYCKSVVFGVPLLLLQGCASFDPDPDRVGDISPLPGQPWDPPTNAWYCDDKKIDRAQSGLTFPKISEETDVGELIDFALLHHEVTRESWERARAQAYAYRAEQSALFPTVDWVGSWFGVDSTGPGLTTSTGSGTIGIGKTESIDSRLIISYLLLDFGGRNANIEFMYRALEAANWSQNMAIQNVIINIMQRYYAYINAKETLIAREDDLKNATINMEAAQELYKAGVGKKVDFIQAQASVENARLSLIIASNAVELFLGQLAVGLGLPPETQLQIRNLPSQFPVNEVEVNLDHLFKQMETSRPDMAAAYANFLQSKANLRSRVSDSLPTLTSQVNVENTKYVYNAKVRTHFYDVAVQLNIPIFNGFYHKNKIKEAKENVKAAYYHYEVVEAEAQLEVLNAYYQFLASKQSMKSAEEFLRFSEEAYDLSLGSYKAGIGSILSLFTSQSDLSNARAKIIEARTNWAVSLFNMAFATGTLTTQFLSEKLPPKLESESLL